MRFAALHLESATRRSHLLAHRSSTSLPVAQRRICSRKVLPEVCQGATQEDVSVLRRRLSAAFARERSPLRNKVVDGWCLRRKDPQSRRCLIAQGDVMGCRIMERHVLLLGQRSRWSTMLGSTPPFC